MSAIISLLAFAGVVAILIGSLFVGRFFYLKSRGNPTGKFTEHNFEEVYDSEGLGVLLFITAFLVTSYVGIFVIWIEVLMHLTLLIN